MDSEEKEKKFSAGEFREKLQKLGVRSKSMKLDSGASVRSQSSSLPGACAPTRPLRDQGQNVYSFTPIELGQGRVAAGRTGQGDSSSIRESHFVSEAASVPPQARVSSCGSDEKVADKPMHSSRSRSLTAVRAGYSPGVGESARQTHDMSSVEEQGTQKRPASKLASSSANVFKGPSVEERPGPRTRESGAHRSDGTVSDDGVCSSLATDVSTIGPTMSATSVADSSSVHTRSTGNTSKGTSFGWDKLSLGTTPGSSRNAPGLPRGRSNERVNTHRDATLSDGKISIGSTGLGASVGGFDEEGLQSRIDASPEVQKLRESRRKKEAGGGHATPKTASSATHEQSEEGTEEVSEVSTTATQKVRQLFGSSFSSLARRLGAPYSGKDQGISMATEQAPSKEVASRDEAADQHADASEVHDPVSREGDKEDSVGAAVDARSQSDEEEDKWSLSEVSVTEVLDRGIYFPLDGGEYPAVRRVPFDVFRDNESFNQLLDFAEGKRLGDFQGKCCYPVMKCGDDEDPTQVRFLVGDELYRCCGHPVSKNADLPGHDGLCGMHKKFGLEELRVRAVKRLDLEKKDAAFVAAQQRKAQRLASAGGSSGRRLDALGLEPALPKDELERRRILEQERSKIEEQARVSASPALTPSKPVGPAPEFDEPRPVSAEKDSTYVEVPEEEGSMLTFENLRKLETFQISTPRGGSAGQSRKSQASDVSSMFDGASAISVSDSGRWKPVKSANGWRYTRAQVSGQKEPLLKVVRAEGFEAKEGEKKRRFIPIPEGAEGFDVGSDPERNNDIVRFQKGADGKRFGWRVMVVNGEVRYTGAGCRWVTLDPVKCCVCGGELGAYVDDTYRAFCGHTCMEEAGSELGDDEVRSVDSAQTSVLAPIPEYSDDGMIKRKAGDVRKRLDAFGQPRPETVDMQEKVKAAREKAQQEGSKLKKHQFQAAIEMNEDRGMFVSTVEGSEWESEREAALWIDERFETMVKILADCVRLAEKRQQVADLLISRCRFEAWTSDAVYRHLAYPEEFEALMMRFLKDMPEELNERASCCWWSRNQADDRASPPR